MIQLTGDDVVVALLSRVQNDLAEIRDPSGKVIGYYAPVALDHARLYADIAAHIDREELNRRKNDGEKGHTTREVFEHLLSQTTDERMRAYLREKIEVLKERDECATP